MQYAIPPAVAAAAIELAVRRGWDLNALLLSAGISPMSATRLTDAQIRRLVRAAWQMTDDDLLGLGVHRVPRGTLRMLCFAMASVPDLDAAITRFAEFTRTVAGLPGVELDLDGAEAIIRIDTSAFDEPGHLRTIVTAVGTHRLIGWTIGKRLPVRRIELPFPAPSSTGDLEALLGETLRFDADGLALVLDREVLKTPVLLDDSSLLALLKDAPTALLSPPPGVRSTTRLVQRAIEQRLKDHQVPTAEELAQRLSMSEPALRRKLRAEGTSLREIRDAVLCRTAIAGLERDAEPVAVLSERLGFSEPSAFTRAFRRWTGRPPSAYRVAARQPNG